MKIKTLTAAVLLATGAIAGNASATTITNTNGTNPFDGFDWAAGGTAFTQGFTGTAGNTFTLTYFAVATAFTLGGNNFILPGLDTVPNGVPGGPPPTGSSYEYTIVATLNETVQSCVPINPPGNSQCTFDVNGGTFNVYYDTSMDANAQASSNGTGFADGNLLISGTINPLFGQTFDTVTGANTTTLHGVVTFTNGAFISPALVGTTATTTLQQGGAVTSYVNPGGFNGTPFSALQGADDVVFQADGNQSFTAAVPEPASIALLGLGLGALGWSIRRKQG